MTQTASCHVDILLMHYVDSVAQDQPTYGCQGLIWSYIVSICLKACFCMTLHIWHAYQLFLTLMWEIHVSDVGVGGSMWEIFKLRQNVDILYM